MLLEFDGEAGRWAVKLYYVGFMHQPDFVEPFRAISTPSRVSMRRRCSATEKIGRKAYGDFHPDVTSNKHQTDWPCPGGNLQGERGQGHVRRGERVLSGARCWDSITS